MLDYTALAELGTRLGFSAVQPLNPATIELRPEVREMCVANKCGKFNSNWSCPPACGTLEECRARIDRFGEGILVQTVGELEDEFDGEAMMETEVRHKAQFFKMFDELRTHYPRVLAIGAGTCKQCAKCTYPDAPCRFPERRASSMEAYGMLVMDVCKANGLKYYYGSDHIAYTSCFLLGEE